MVLMYVTICWHNEIFMNVELTSTVYLTCSFKDGEKKVQSTHNYHSCLLYHWRKVYLERFKPYFRDILIIFLVT